MTQKKPGPGRPNLSGNFGTQSPSITLRIAPLMMEKIQAVSQREGVHHNQVIRAAIDAYVHERLKPLLPLGDYDMPAHHRAVRGETSAEKSA